MHRLPGKRVFLPFSLDTTGRRDQANADTRHQFGGKIAAGHCGCFFMKSERQERNSLCGSSAAAIESDTSSTIAHCPCDLRITALFGSTLFVLSFSEVGTAETQAQSPLLRILTSVKTTFACHPCESSCIGLLARNPSRIARRKGDPAGGVSMGSSPKALAAMINGRIRQSFFIALGYLKLVMLVTRPQISLPRGFVKVWQQSSNNSAATNLLCGTGWKMIVLHQIVREWRAYLINESG